mmetsp:Transcript_94727/g.216689  ORF Transcript_94727/g.216689 Transcript_94727/m.216689 type:complete len:360 (+) Transcript_94727:387-1466(+)
MRTASETEVPTSSTVLPPRGATRCNTSSTASTTTPPPWNPAHAAGLRADPHQRDITTSANASESHAANNASRPGRGRFSRKYCAATVRASLEFFNPAPSRSNSAMRGGTTKSSRVSWKNPATHFSALSAARPATALITGGGVVSTAINVQAGQFAVASRPPTTATLAAVPDVTRQTPPYNGDRGSRPRRMRLPRKAAICWLRCKSGVSLAATTSVEPSAADAPATAVAFACTPTLSPLTKVWSRASMTFISYRVTSIPVPSTNSSSTHCNAADCIPRCQAAPTASNRATGNTFSITGGTNTPARWNTRSATPSSHGNESRLTYPSTAMSCATGCRAKLVLIWPQRIGIGRQPTGGGVRT